MITTPIFTRIMTESEFGRFGVYNSWYSIISVVITLGITGNCFTRAVVLADCEKTIEELSSSLYGLVIALFASCGIVYVIFHEWINGITNLSTYQFLMMGIDIITTQASYIWINTKKVRCEYKGIIWLTLIVTVLKSLLAIIFIACVPESAQAEARITGISIANVMAFSWIAIYIFKNSHKFYDGEKWKYALKFCLPLIPHYLSQIILGQSDRIMISYYVGNSEAAYYSVAYTLAAIVSIFNNAVSQTLVPWIFKSIRCREFDRIERISYRVMAIVALLNIVVMTVGPELLLIMAPSSYSNALQVIPPVTASMFFVFMYDLFASFQFYFKETRFIAIGSCVAGALNIVLNAALIPSRGYIAAGYTTLVCYILFGILHYRFMRFVCKKHLNECRVYDWKIVFGMGLLVVMAAYMMGALYYERILRYTILIIVLLVVSVLIMRKK